MSPRHNIGVQSPHGTIIIDGVSIAYTDEGIGTPVVCLHATAQGGRDFHHFRDRILKHGGYRLIVLDWAGHGRSASDKQAFSAIRCEEVLTQFLQQLNITKPLIIGNSIGGATALRYAAKHSDKVQAVIACNPGGLAPVNAIAKVFCSVMASIAGLGERKSAFFKPIFSLLCAALLRTLAAREQRQRIIEAGYDNATVMRQAWHSFRQPDGDIRPLLSAIQCPVLFAWAKDDNIVALSASKAAIATVANHKLKLFTGGHAAFLESPDEFFAEFVSFSQDLQSNASA